jgi:hypothetical protein
MLGLCDPIKIFVKNEPHSNSKLSEGRVRLISCVSMVDEIIERILCGRQNKAEIFNWRKCPSKPGIGLTTDAQNEEFWKFVSDKLEELADSDVSGWDWCFKFWMLQLDVEARIALAGAHSDSDFAWCIRNRFYCLASAVFVLPNGQMVEQLTLGVMKSGSYVTSSTNSRGRVFVAWLIGCAWAYAAGDDCLEDFQNDAEAKYAELGIKIKAYHKFDGAFEFCSHRFTSGVAQSVQFFKGLYRYLSYPFSQERFTQFVDEYRNSPELPDCLEGLAHLRGDGPTQPNE